MLPDPHASALPFLGDMTDDDVVAAMREAGGYLDIAPADALALYRLAYAHAAARLARDVPVAQLMTRDVATASPGDTVLDAARRMAAAGVSGLPVLEADGSVAGVVSTRDLLRHAGLAANAGPAALLALLLDPAACAAATPSPRAGEATVAAVMTRPAACVAPETGRLEAARLMAAQGINRLPVVAAGLLCGIVSRGDVARSCRDIPGGCGL